MPTDIIFGNRATIGVDVKSVGAGLWLSGDDLKRVSGWEHKPQGFCKGDVCVTVPAGRANEFVSNGAYNLAALANLLGLPSVSDAEFSAWCFGAAASERKRSLTSLDAPDFTLPDLDGKLHSLHEHRGKKVLVVSWASW
jgi:hypothetical protein